MDRPVETEARSLSIPITSGPSSIVVIAYH